ncbi:MAG TPA: hypothetical protein VK083_13525 [Nocardia sp.]|uniref:hypothetical protein n=1 Tax=Nocardia sp. TaxID=1821 RepID=UPI002B4AFED8|nr:hypothetical protein [Nocardia sp.]HLS77801.1 hypothetical protein [Nocardia sp.]
MHRSIHPSAAGRRDALARLRGGSAGAVSGAVSIAAHGWAAGSPAPATSTLTLLAAASALVGALVTGLGPLRETTSGLVAALVAGQVLGHLTLGAGTGHAAHGGAGLSREMLAAHLVAALFAALVIRGAEAAYRIATSVLAGVLPGRPPLISFEPAPLRTRYRERVVLRVLAARAARTRAPPRAVFA